MTTDITRLSVEATVSRDTKTQVSGLSVEAVVAPFPQKTSIGSIPVEALVSKTFKTFISNLSVEAVVAPAPVVVPIEPSDIGVLMLNLLSEVITTDKYLSLTGTFNPEETITGWIFDKRRLEDWNNISTRYGTFLGGHKAGLLDGTALLDWRSGTVSGIYFLSLVSFYFKSIYHWTPEVSIGNYSVYWDSRNLYSDKSVSQNFSENILENGLQYLELDSDLKSDSCQVALWKRTPKKHLMKVWDFNQVDTFTGSFSAGERINTENDSGDFIPANISDRKKEFLLRNNKIYLNSNYVRNVGWDDELVDLNTEPVQTIKDLWESKGFGSGDGRYLFADYFPIQQGAIRVAELIAGIWTEYEEVDTLNFSRSTDLHFEIDYDLGIVKTSGYKAPDLYLLNSIDEFDDELFVFSSTVSFDSYPAEGILTIGSEEILYYEKGFNSFKDLIRGYNGTTAVVHSIGEKVQDLQHGKKMQGDIYISYKAVPRVDYEVSNHTKRIANAASYLNVLPLSSFSTSGVLQIRSNEKDLKSIILSTDIERIGGNTYGPLFIGTDTARLTALALDSNNEPVDELPIWIEIIKGPGTLNSNGTRYDSITNAIGEIYAYYHSPLNQNEIENHVSLTEHASGNTQMTISSLNPGVAMRDIWVFQILKNDPIFGTIGEKVEILDSDSTVDPWGDTVIQVDGLFDEDYVDGLFICIGTDSIRYVKSIETVFQTLDADDIPITEITFYGVSDPSVFLGQNCYLLKKESVQWVPALKNGSKHILYEWSDEVLHPIKNTLGAWTPLHPDSRDGNTLIFNDRLLTIPDPIDDDLNLGGYFVIAPSLVEFQAFGIDPLSGRLISSNIIKIYLYLNNSLIGVRNNDSLPIPIGWTLVTEEHNVGSALGGANFITINAKAENINQFCLTGTF